MKHNINTCNANFADRAIVYFTFSNDFVVIRTYSAVYGRSNRFYTPVVRLSELVCSEQHSFCDVDCGSTLVINRLANGSFRFSINWTSIMSDDTLHGYNQTFVIPAAVLEYLLDSRCDIRLLVDVHQKHTHSPVVITESAHRLIAKLSALERRALSKALRNCWRYGPDDSIELFADWDHDFFFFDNDLCGGFNGGLCQHTGTITGKDGAEHSRIRYEIHT